MQINFSVKQQVITAECSGRLVIAESRGHVYAQFSLDEEWDGLTVTALFSNDYVPTGARAVVLTGKKPVEIPPEILVTGKLRVSLVGVRDEGRYRLTTLYMEKPIIVFRSGAVSGNTSNETPDLWEQVLALIGDLDDLNTSEKQTLVAAINEAAKTGSGNGGSVALDPTLTQTGKAAEAKAVGDALAQLASNKVDSQQGAANAGKVLGIGDDGLVKPVDAPSDSGLTDAEKTLIITILRNAVYSNNQSANIAALEALFNVSGGGGTEPDVPVEPDIPDEPDEPDVPVVTLTGITATYNGGDVAVGTAVKDLTSIVVIAHYSDGSTATVTGYTLSGTIAEGSNTITVSYSGKTTTFTVTGVAESATWEPVIVTYSGVTGTPELAGKIYSDDGQTELAKLTRGKYLSEVFETDTMVSVTIANSGTKCYVGHCVYINNATYNVYNAVAVASGKTETVEMIIPSGQQLIVVGNYSQHVTVEAKKKVVA